MITSNSYISLGTVAERIFASGKITGENNPLEKSILTPNKMNQDRGLFDRLQMGLLKVVD